MLLTTRKKVIIWLILLILMINCNSVISAHSRYTVPVGKHISNAFTNFQHQFDPQCKPVSILYRPYEAQDIDLKDAAFHKPLGRISVEWWYFEGVFDNGYSFIVGAMIFTKGSRGFCHLGLQVYVDAELEFDLKKDVPIEEFEASEEYPSITVSGKQFMKLDREKYNATGEWVYNVSLELEGHAAYLEFRGLTEGYKGRILRGGYGPHLPKASVNGTLILNGEEINVSGRGYHEHAWGITLPVWENGWYWGKITTDSFNLFYVKMMQTRWREQQRFAILSIDNSSYIQIKPENIKFRAYECKFNDRRLIPTKFMLNITDPENGFYLNATMEKINIHCMMGKINRYYRYHVRINGEMSYGSKTEIIDEEIQMVELVRFPSLIPLW